MNTQQKPFISISSDFGINSEGVGIMMGTVIGLCPTANVINLTHGIESFNVADGARELETAYYLPVGLHVCVVDPGVGSRRKAIIIETARGDRLIGPDNGVLLPAAERLGGITGAFEIKDSEWIDMTSSRTFNGRDVFAKAAGLLAAGVDIEAISRPISAAALYSAAFAEATAKGHEILATALHVNKFGSVILNIKESVLDDMDIRIGSELAVTLNGNSGVALRRARSFSDVPPGTAVLVPDDYGRVELAVNLGSFSAQYSLGSGAAVTLTASMAAGRET